MIKIEFFLTSKALDRQPDISVGNNFTEKAKQIVREDGNGTAEIGEASQESVRLALLW